MKGTFSHAQVKKIGFGQGLVSLKHSAIYATQHKRDIYPSILAKAGKTWKQSRVSDGMDEDLHTGEVDYFSKALHKSKPLEHITFWAPSLATDLARGLAERVFVDGPLPLQERVDASLAK